MAEESKSKPTSARKAPPGLSIKVPDQEGEGAAKQKPASDAAAASGRTSARGAEESGRRSSVRGAADGRTSGRHSARGGAASARGGQPKTVICHESVIKGNVTFGEGCIVHPGA